MKIKKYEGQTFKGGVTVTYKIDGIQLIVKDGLYKSRSGKPLYNLPEGLKDGVYEVYRENFEKTISTIRSSITPQEPIKIDEVYRLDIIDPRLVKKRLSGTVEPKEIEDNMNEAIKDGYEGLVIIDNTGGLYKVKTTYTDDIEVLGVIPGKGKHEGRMGALITSKGKVGTGFTDYHRMTFTKDFIIGKIIEVSFMEETTGGKFRHPRFIRLREDKK